MVILGVDPGTALTGWGIVRKLNRRSGKLKKFRNGYELLEYGCVRTSNKSSMPERLLMLRRGLSEVIRRYNPRVIVVERLFFNTNAKTAISVGQARGVIMLLAAEYKIDFFEYTALQAKRILTGYGRATKRDMQYKVSEYLGLKEKIKPDDAADALAMAIYHGEVMK